MSRSQLGTLVAILATVANVSALAAGAHAQIPASTGGDVVSHDPLPLPGDPTITLTHGYVAFQWGCDETNFLLTGTVHIAGDECATASRQSGGQPSGAP